MNRPVRNFLSLVAALLAALTAGPCAFAAGVEFPGPEPGRATIEAKASDGARVATFTLENKVIAASWEVRAGGIHPADSTGYRSMRGESRVESIPSHAECRGIGIQAA